MSSHHFVREGQEPALIIVDALGLELTEPLLEWVPQVIILDWVIEPVMHWGIKIDVVIHSKCSDELLTDLRSHQFPLRILPAAGNDPLATALQFLKDNHQTAVNLLMEISEERFALLETFSSLNVNVITRNEKWLLCRDRFEKWVPQGSVLSIRPTYQAQSISLEGGNLQGPVLTARADGTIRILSPDLFWVGEHL